MKKSLLFASALIIALSACASTTPEDHLVVDGEGHLIRADPLWRYLSTACPYEKLEAYVNNFYKPNWPNLTRYWELKGKFLHLLKIEDSEQKPYPLELLFSEYDGSPVRAKWFSGNVSYRLGESPIIQLNHEFYEEERVIRFVKGREVERFVINHRERWLSYARNIMDQYRPLAGFSPDIPEASSGGDGLMKGFLNEAFAVVTNPKGKPALYGPLIWINFQSDLDGFEITEAHKELSSYELLESIAAEMQSELSVTITNRLVTYEIRPADLTKSELEAPASAHSSETNTPSI
jgi:hypothetical protein